MPAIDESIQFELQKYSPYLVRADNHDSDIFHIQGDILARLYEKFGERLLQQNIRGSVGDKGTNAAILDSCTTNKLGHPLSDDIIIPLKEGAQSYAASYCRLPGIAKRNPKFRG